MRVFVLLIFFFSVILYYFFHLSPLKNDKIVYIEKEKNLKEISFILEKNNILPSSYPFYFYFRILERIKSIKAGEYLFKKNVSFFEVSKTLNKNNLNYKK